MTEAHDTSDDRVLDRVVVEARSDREAFGRLYDETYPAVFRYCVRRLGDRSLGEDMASTVFVSVAQNIRDFRGETFVDFRRWVFTIATNAMKAHYRQTNRRQSLLMEAVETGRLHQSAQHNGQASTEEAGTLQDALRRLSERDATIIHLRYFAELPYEDIGRILEISAEAARKAASRAISQMRKEVGTT